MKVVLDGYFNKKICVAVSGGKDSMALLHWLYTNSEKYGVTLSALNCDHKIRGEASARDSAFVKKWCEEHGVPLYFFERGEGAGGSEEEARKWRLSRYAAAIEAGEDVIATAHHLNDNAETVLFNLSRGASLSGMTGIAYENKKARIIRPLISASRAEIDEYVKENNVPYVVDETNFTENYTRNKIRLNVIPKLEEAVPCAVKNIYRFSRLAAEDEEYFDELIKELGLIEKSGGGYYISYCKEKVIFRRAVIKILADAGKKDYTYAHVQRLFELQFAQNGKKFEFLNLTACKEGDKIFIFGSAENSPDACVSLEEYLAENKEDFFGQPLIITEIPPETDNFFKTLKFDLSALPAGSEVRFMRAGDKFKKFGGGTKNLGDYFTDLKIPVRVRECVPLIACGSEALIVCGTEISDKVKITPKTQSADVRYISCKNYTLR